MYRVPVAIVFAAALSGCSASSPAEMTNVSLDQLVQTPPGKYRDSNASADAKIQQPAFATLPPEAGRIVRVSHKSSVEGLWQRIFYDQSAPGLEASGIDLRIRTSSAATLDEPLRMAKPTEAGIRSELASQFPKMPMQVVDRPRSNAYGPYGLAVGRWANGTRCVYAWQWIDNVKGTPSGEGGPASVRVRLCRKDVTLDQLAANVDRLKIDFNPVVEQTGVVAVNADDRILASVPETSKPRTRARVAHQRKPVRVASAAGKPQAVRAAAISPIQPAVQGFREAPLDSSLPAAAYRGPITTGSTASAVKK
jgi:Cellulose biosynthesis protein BcsN